MFRRVSLLGVLASASASFAGFNVTATKISVAGFDRWDIVAVNTGGDTGTQIKGLEYFYSGSPAAFQVDDTSDPSGGDPDGIADTVNLLSTNRTRIRVSAIAANNVFVGVSPTNGFAQPNPYAAGPTSFSGAIANTGVTQASGAGFQIARLYLPVGGYGTLSGNLGGDIGSKVPFSVTTGFVDYAIFVRSITPNPVPVVFGPVVTGGAAFSTTIEIDGAPFGSNVFMTLDTLPGGLRDVTVTGGGTTSRTFVVSGIVDYALNGNDVAVQFTAHCPGIFGPVAPGSFTLHVTPEPTLFAATSLLVLCPRRQRGPR